VLTLMNNVAGINITFAFKIYCLGVRGLTTSFYAVNDCTISGHTDLKCIYRGADKSLSRPTSRCILFDDENISFFASLVIYIYIYSINIPPIIIINMIYETQNLLSL
jgi:hypothetical protein